ncbi:retrovirus-related Pol polyprotein from transposon 412 [Trichonephila clavipes]|nr:retrovirus-related Pol polyprotein from transposon 412 [Trichonephila clavipes]
MAHENIKWTETLPAVLLGLRVAVKPDINASSAELVYGVSLRLPAEICTDTSSMPLDYGFVQQLKNHMNHLKPLSTSTHGFSKIFVHPKLDDCSHVFLRVDKVSPSLSQPYTGPHEVLSRNDKHITININGKKSCVSLDRVKPAFVFKDLQDTIPDPIISAESSHQHPVTTNMQTTKSGRREVEGERRIFLAVAGLGLGKNQEYYTSLKKKQFNTENLRNKVPTTMGLLTSTSNSEVKKACIFCEVIRLSSSTTPIRPVFGASARLANYPSLNQCLACSPNLIELIPDILLPFRERGFGVIADIRKAFLQINILKDDRDFLRLLWWEKRD